jgi:pimeloyl-ACP methyl ester carboxylesterase
VLTAALNWYRARPMLDPRSVGKKITVPTMFAWTDGDTALLEKAARNSALYVSGEYRFEVLHGSHWMVDEQSDVVADLLSESLAVHPI